MSHPPWQNPPVMNPHLTEIAFILDRSGSMQPLQEAAVAAFNAFVPRGSTALLDAIGRTITDTARRLAALPAAEQPAQVIFAIFTDGEENASREYTARHISDLIRLHRTENGWEFLFLAANQDAIASAGALLMDAQLSANVSFSVQGMKSTGGAMARKVRAMRMKSTGTMDAQAREDDAKSMDQIVKEEEGKDL